jgi:hypothetical protein
MLQPASGQFLPCRSSPEQSEEHEHSADVKRGYCRSAEHYAIRWSHGTDCRPDRRRETLLDVQRRRGVSITAERGCRHLQWDPILAGDGAHAAPYSEPVGSTVASKPTIAPVNYFQEITGSDADLHNHGTGKSCRRSQGQLPGPDSGPRMDNGDHGQHGAAFDGRGEQSHNNLPWQRNRQVVPERSASRLSPLSDREDVSGSSHDQQIAGQGRRRQYRLPDRILCEQFKLGARLNDKHIPIFGRDV